MKLSLTSPIGNPDYYLHVNNRFCLALSGCGGIFRRIGSLGLITINSFDDTRRDSPASET